MEAISLSGRTATMTAAQAIVVYLQAQFSERDGVRQRLVPAMFGIFGHGNVSGMSQALLERGSGLPYYQPCNEQAMVHTAAGFAKANKRLRTLACCASIGPGATNMLTGAALATVNRLPVLLLPADSYAQRYQGKVLQQLEHPISADASVNDCFRTVSKFFDRIARPEQLLEALPEAMRVLTDPAETGAVTIALPQDIISQAYPFPQRLFEPKAWTIERRQPQPDAIAEAVRLLQAAKRPVIIAGGGTIYSDAGSELLAFAERFGIPVSETFAGKGAIRGETALLLGGQGVEGTPPAARFVGEADAVIAIGSRMTDFTTGSMSAFRPDARFIAINVNARDAGKLGALPIVADAREALKALHQAAEDAGLAFAPDYAVDVAAAVGAWKRQLDEAVQPAETERTDGAPALPMTQGQLIRILNEEARSGDTVVAAAGSPPGDLLKTWDAQTGKQCHLEFGFSCMGYEIPAAIGVRMASGEAGEVYALIGDGTYLMNPTELVTAVQERLKITVVISENHGYQVIRRLQLASVGRSFGNEFRTRSGDNRLEGPYVSVDYALNAASMGVRTWKAATPQEVRKALREARNEPGPCAIVVETAADRFLPGSGVWWDVAPAEVSGDPETQQLRRTYEADRNDKQRFHY
ncbi:MAG: 3D-(3,5/4)-trihydroxycyclohexane-1,2-dione acylhydrolase (decyclizing) [Paenibacillaceae bacterium]|nr:3D-(3,5/4)-trihydroxycyclohexane-1,2-dione acylhydrolase (decyclizing) [Paenibacillaceae bacterium]